MSDRAFEVKLDGLFDEGNLAQVKLALHCDSPLSKRTDIFLHGTWLNKAASYGQFEILKYLLGIGLDPDMKDNRYGRRPINEASTKGHLEIVRFLLERRVKLDTHASIANPLFGCIAGYAGDQHPVHGSDTPPENYLEIAKLLLDHGIDYDVRYNTETMKNMDAMAFACMWGRQDIAQLIAERKAGGDTNEVKRLLAEADQIAEENTEPVPEGETVRPS